MYPPTEMGPTADDIRITLEKQGYHWHDGFSHRSITAFVGRYFFVFNPVILVFWAAQLASLGIAVWFASVSGHTLGFAVSFLAGMALFIILIPLHEWLHGVGYKWAGAPRVEYRVLWKHFVFYAIADCFITARWPFVFLALAPFIIINGLLVLLIFILSPGWTPWLCGALFMHVAGCSGDFALLSYFYTQWSKEPVTFDDARREESHFFIRKDS